MLLVLVAVALAACGDDERAEYVAKADRICRDGVARAGEFANVEPATARGARRAADELEAAGRRLSALEPPRELRRDVAAYMETFRRHVELYRQVIDMSDAAAARLAASPSTKRLNERAAELAKRIGFEECG